MSPLLFEFHKTFDTTVAVGDKQLPIHIKRLSRAELDALRTEYDRVMVPPRGSAPVSAAAGSDAEVLRAAQQAEADRLADWNTKIADDRLRFFEQVIRDDITLDAGLIEDDGKAVTDGTGLIGVFYARRDVLRDLIAAVYVENHLGTLLRKNSNSPRDSGTGSAPSSQARGGDGPAPTASNVARFPTAVSAAATVASPETLAAAARASSGLSDEDAAAT